MTRGRHGRSKTLKLDRQLSLRLDSPMEHGGFTAPALAQRVDSVGRQSGRPIIRPVCGTFPSLESLASHVQSLDRARLLEPTSMPKVLRGWDPRPRPKTAIISYAAQRAYERRIARELGYRDPWPTFKQFLAQRDRQVSQLAARLRKQFRGESQ